MTVLYGVIKEALGKKDEVVMLLKEYETVKLNLEKAEAEVGALAKTVTELTL